jgi:Uma2 family endonuclease
VSILQPTQLFPEIITSDLIEYLYFQQIMVATRTPYLSFEDYLHHDDGTEHRHELMDGSLVRINPPSIEHFLIAKFLEKILDIEIQRLNLPWLALREVGVRTGVAKSRLVDLCVVTKDQARELTGQSAVFQTPPVMVVEVVSPESVIRDYRYKRSEYAAAGISEYWIIDPIENKVTLLHLEEGFYEATPLTGNQMITSTTFNQLQLSVDCLLAASTIS